MRLCMCRIHPVISAKSLSNIIISLWLPKKKVLIFYPLEQSALSYDIEVIKIFLQIIQPIVEKDNDT